MDALMDGVGVREAKNRFSALAAQVNATGRSVMVYKNNRPWVVIGPADADSSRRRERLERLHALTARIEDGACDEPAWDASRTDRDLLNEERVDRFG